MSQTAASLPTGDPTQPVLTWYDDGTGERVELSGLTLSNWVAKTANLLVDGCGLGPGDTALVALPPHWQTAAVLLGCWTAGLSVSSGAATATSRSRSAASTRRPATGSCSGSRRWACRCAGRRRPAGWTTSPRCAGTATGSCRRPRPDAGDPALGTETHGALVERALARAADLGIPTGGRVLIDAGAYPDPVDWLLAPFASGASVVLCKDLDPAGAARRAEAERAGLIRERDTR